jgi:hypothetical protein
MHCSEAYMEELEIISEKIEENNCEIIKRYFLTGHSWLTIQKVSNNYFLNLWTIEQFNWSEDAADEIEQAKKADFILFTQELGGGLSAKYYLVRKE